MEDIARQLVQALTEYFGLPFIQPMDPKRGTVRLSYGTLNLRSTPVLRRHGDRQPAQRRGR